MCTTCGCGEGSAEIIGPDRHYQHDADHHHHHHHRDESVPERETAPNHVHAPGMSQARMVKVEQDILAKNDVYAMENRRYFTEHGILALNLVSSPGSGKTTLLTSTIPALQSLIDVAVIEGDQQTSRDAERIRATGVPSVQINTGKGCHLDAHMISHALERLESPHDVLLLIENVGNLVCPAAFDLGEAHKVVILSVTEGDDKPLKYPDMFHAADLMVLNKIDLLPYVDFGVERCMGYARRVNPDIQTLQVSATRGDGMETWLAWVQQRWQEVVRKRQPDAPAPHRGNTEIEVQETPLRANPSR